MLTWASVPEPALSEADAQSGRAKVGLPFSPQR